MSKTDFKCPACQQSLDGKRVCPQCQCDLDDVNRDTSVDPAALAQLLASMGAAIHVRSSDLLLPIRNFRSFVSYPINNTKGYGASDLMQMLLTRSGLSARRLRSEHVTALVTALRYGMVPITEVERMGDRPVLLRAEDGSLYWPDYTQDGARLVRSLRMFYVGPAIKPEHNGSFDEFLDSCRCASDTDREMLRTYMLTAMVQGAVMGPGTYPVLMIAATALGTGKSTTARTIARILGGHVMLHAKQLLDTSDCNRLVTDPNTRTIIIDNMAPTKGEGYINSSALAFLITSDSLTVKRLYESYGTITMLNDYLYFMTANKTNFSCELFSRLYTVTLNWEPRLDMDEVVRRIRFGGELSAETVENRNRQIAWEKEWGKRREEVLADMIAIALDNWNQGPVPVPKEYAYHRFLDWMFAAARLTRKPPPMWSSKCVIRPPLEMALGEVFKQSARDSMSLEEVEKELREMRGPHQQMVEEANWVGTRILVDMADTHVGGFDAYKENGSWHIRKI